MATGAQNPNRGTSGEEQVPMAGTSVMAGESRQALQDAQPPVASGSGSEWRQLCKSVKANPVLKQSYNFYTPYSPLAAAILAALIISA
jgi:hypothetical protein